MAKIITVKEAAELMQDGTVIGSAVQGMTGQPEEIGLVIENRLMETGHPSGITHIHGAGQGDFGRMSGDGRTCRGECALARDGLLSCNIHDHVGCSFKVTKQIVDNKILTYNIPLGVVGRIWRGMGRGFPGLLTKVGLDTFMDPRYDRAMINEKAKKKERQIITYIPGFLGEEYLFYTLPKLTVALLRATTADEDGNLIYEKEYIPCEPLDLAMAAKAAGAIVITQVRRVAVTGTLDPRNVKVPGILVDYICVTEYPDRMMQTHITHFNPVFTEETRILMKNSTAPLPLGDKKVFIGRTAMEVHEGDKCSLGIGMSGLVPNVFMEEGIDSQVTLISEPGLIGEIPAPEGDFGAHYNPVTMYPQTDHFSFFDQGELDVAVFGLSKVDRDGNVNTTFLNGRIAGMDGFPNISASTRHSIFVGSFTAGGLKCHIEDGKMYTDQEGRFGKFVGSCTQLSFNAQQCLAKGNRVTFIMERCVIRRAAQGMVLTEVAPGIGVQTQILDHMDFKPIIPEGGPVLVDASLFSETRGRPGDHFQGSEETCMRKMELDNYFVYGSLNPIGLHLDITEGEGWARTLWAVEKPYVGYEGMLHGDIMASIMDDLMVHTLYYTDLDVVTAHLELDYKAPVHAGEQIEYEAQVTELGAGRPIRARDTIKREGAVAARAKGVMVIVKAPGQEIQPKSRETPQ